MIRVTVWNENVHERKISAVRSIYPDGIHGAIVNALNGNDDIQARAATLEQPDCGITDEVLRDTDVMLWWGHMEHQKVPDEIALKVQNQVNKGMGFIALHSAHYSKPFKRLMGTSCSLRWRDGAYERVWCLDPGHPIAEDIPPYFELENEEMYGEFFDIPKPESLVFAGWFRTGEIFRSGCCWTRGLGRVFYFQPGHETYPIYHNPVIQRILLNAVRWAAPRNRRDSLDCKHHIPVEQMVLQGEETGWY